MIKFQTVILICAFLLLSACDDNEPTGPGTPPGSSTLSADSITLEEVYLSWTSCNNSDFQSYRLYRSLTEGVANQDTLSMDCVYYTYESSLTSFTDSGVEQGNTYYYSLITNDTEALYAWSNEVSAVINDTLNCPDSISATIAITSPRGVCFSSSGEYAYVASFSGSVSIVRTSDHTVINTIDYLPMLNSICTLPGGEYVYAVWFEDTDQVYESDMVVIETASNTITTTIPLGLNARGLCAVPGRDLVYVCNAGEESIFVIDTESHSVIDTVQTGSYNTRGVCALPSGDYVYATRTNSDDVIVISTATNEIVDNIYIGWSSPDGITALPSGDYVYVGCWGNRVGIIRTSDNTLVKTLNVPAGVRELSAHPDGDYVYVTNHDDIEMSIIDTNLMQIVGQIDLTSANSSKFVCCSPDGDLVYVTSPYDNIVSAIE